MKNIVLVHGWGASSAKLEPIAHELQKLGWNTFVPKLPGFDLPVAKSVWGVRDYSRYVYRKSKVRFGNKRFYIFGHSFGGRIASYLGSKRKSKLNGLIFCATGGISRGNRLKLAIFLVLAKLGRIIFFIKPIDQVANKILYKFAREHDYESIKSSVLKATFRRIISEDIKPFIKQITLPTLILWGAIDKMTPIKDAYFVYKTINGSKIKIYKKTGHALPYLMPKSLAKEITNWQSTLK